MTIRDRYVALATMIVFGPMVSAISALGLAYLVPQSQFMDALIEGILYCALATTLLLTIAFSGERGRHFAKNLCVSVCVILLFGISLLFTATPAAIYVLMVGGMDMKGIH